MFKKGKLVLVEASLDATECMLTLAARSFLVGLGSVLQQPQSKFWDFWALSLSNTLVSPHYDSYFFCNIKSESTVWKLVFWTLLSPRGNSYNDTQQDTLRPGMSAKQPNRIM